MDDLVTRSENLVGGLSGEIERVALKAQRWRDMMAEHPSLAGGMKLGLAVMESQLADARKALNGGDPLEMMPALQALRDYDSDD
jgi:hypothetical protein